MSHFIHTYKAMWDPFWGSVQGRQANKADTLSQEESNLLVVSTTGEEMIYLEQNKQDSWALEEEVRSLYQQ